MIYDICTETQTIWEQGWCRDQSPRLPQIWPGLGSILVATHGLSLLFLYPVLRDFDLICCDSV